MNKSMKIYLIVSGIIFAVIVSIVLVIGAFTKMFDNFTSHITDNKLVNSVKSAHTDYDIRKYVKETHGFDVKVLENAGPANLKTDLGGYATVVKDDILEFKVFINSFGAISGDNYHYMASKLDVIKKIINDPSLQAATEEIFDEYIVHTDDDKETFELRMTIEPSVILGDDKSLEQLFQVYQVVQDLNKTLDEEYALKIRTLSIFYDDIEAPPLRKLSMDLRDDFESAHDFEAYLIEENSDPLSEMFIKKHGEFLDEVADQFPEPLIWKTSEQVKHLQCIDFISLDECASYKVYLTFSDRSRVSKLDYYRIDEKEFLEDLYEITQFFQASDLSIDQLVIWDVYVPEEDETDEYTQQTVKIHHLQEVTSPSSFEFSM